MGSVSGLTVTNTKGFLKKVRKMAKGHLLEVMEIDARVSDWMVLWTVGLHVNGKKQGIPMLGRWLRGL